MAANERWYFDLEQIHNTPSIRNGFDHDKELSNRQQAANFIQDMGQRLQVNQLCINTAIVYMHRFYMFHSFQRFHRTSLASASLFLAAKVEEQPRKLEHVIRFAQICLHKEQVPFDVNSQSYMEQVQDLIMNENILLQTLGFDVAIDHPHTHIVRCCQLVRASKDLAQTSYFMASYSLHLTTMCLQYKPTVVACFCIHLACKWSNWEIPESSEGKPWFWYVEKSVTSELLENLTAEFLNLFEKCPSRLKKKIMALSSYSTVPSAISNPQSGPPMLGMGCVEVKKKDMLDSHNPMNHMPHPIGSMGAAVANAKASMNMSGAGASSHSHPSHPFLHQNPMINKGTYDGNIIKKHHYEHNQRSSLPPNLPSSLSGQQSDQPYKKLHHPPHHQRDNHNMGMGSSGNKPSCMFEPPLPPQHKAFQQPPSQHTSSSDMSQMLHPLSSSSRGNNHVPQHRSSLPPRPSNIRNGGADHYQEKKYPVEVKREPMDIKPQHLLGPPVQSISRMKVKTPPPQLNLSGPSHLQPLPVKPEKSIFSPEAVVSPPQIKPIISSLPTTPFLPLSSSVQEKPKRESPPPTPRTPVLLKKEKTSPLAVTETVNLPVSAILQESIKPPQIREQPPIIAGDNVKERLSMPVSGVSPPPISAPDTPSKSSHVKKKKKKHKDHKDKHRDKHKHKHRLKDPEPIVITIPKDKITISHPEGLKIKIAKEKISNPPSTPGLKLKISKDKLVKESKKRERSDGEDEDQHMSKQHRPNGTTAPTLEVKPHSNRLSSVLGKSIVSPIRTRDKYECSPPVSPAHIPEYSPTKPGPSLVKTPGHSPHSFNPCSSKPFLSPIAATPRYKSPEPHNNSSQIDNNQSVRLSPQNKPFLSPIAATPKRPNKSKYKYKPPPVTHLEHSGISEISHMSPIQNKPFLSPIAATPVHTGKIKTFKSPPLTHVYGPKTPERPKTLEKPKTPERPGTPEKTSSGDTDVEHLSPLRNKPFLSPIAPTPMHVSKTKTFKSPPTKHVYLTKRVKSHETELPHMSLVENKPFLSPIAPTPRYPSPKHSNSPPVKHCYGPPSKTKLDHSTSPTSSYHSSPDNSYYTDDNKSGSNALLNSSFSPEKSYEAYQSPLLSPHHRESKSLVSPIQTPAHQPDTIKTPPFERVESTDLTRLSETRYFKTKKKLIIDSPEHVTCSVKNKLSSDSGSHNNLAFDLDDKKPKSGDSAPISSAPDSKIPSAGVVTPGRDHSPHVESFNIDSIDCNKSDSSPLFSSLESSDSRCLNLVSRVESGEKCLLSPILTPGHSPSCGDVSKELSISPVVIPRYSPTDPNHFRVGKSQTMPREKLVGEEPTESIAPVRRGPRTPPTPSPYESSYAYDPITPARPDPNEIIFKDSNDNHTKKPSPATSTPQKNVSTPRKYNTPRHHHQRRPILNDFKIPRTNQNSMRKHPYQDSGMNSNVNQWNARGRGRGNFVPPFGRGRGGGRGWNRWDGNIQHRPMMRPPLVTHEHFYQHDGMSYQPQDRRFEYEHVGHQQEAAHQMIQMFETQQRLVPSGNPYDAAVMKHAYETMNMPPEYLMPYQMYLPATPAPPYQPCFEPPLPDEPPPPQPPPPSNP